MRCVRAGPSLLSEVWIYMRILTSTLALCLCAGLAAAQSSTTTTTKTKTKPKTKTTRSNGVRPAASPAKAPVTANPAQPAAVPAPSVQAPKAENSQARLEGVLAQMDKASASFKSAEADFIWEQYQKVIDETDTQKGKIYFLRHDKDTHMAANIVEPDKKDLVFSEGKIRLYQPKIDQVTEYDTGKNKSEAESFLVLGFGGRGHDLNKAFEVKLEGMETMDGVQVARLTLVPRAEKVRNMFERITLWIDPARDISLKQQFFEPSGDHRIARYTSVKMNSKIADDVFKLKTTSKTKTVRPQ